MPRLQALDPAATTGKTHALLEAAGKKLGLVPNMMRTMANSPAVLEGYLGIAGSLGRGPASDAELERVRGAGFGDGEIAEIVAHIALNTLTHSLNRLAATEVDFPKVAALAVDAKR